MPRAIPPEMIARLSREFGGFEPSGLNDHCRQDLAAGPAFVAVDTRPNEIDDAFRIRYTRGGGFLVQTAIADGSQIRPDSKEAAGAIAHGNSEFRGHRRVSDMLPDSVIGILELSPGTGRRAMVIEDEYRPDGEQTRTDVFPATITVERFGHAEFVAHYLRGNGGVRSPIVGFTRALRARQPYLHFDHPEALGGSQSNRQFANSVVQDVMVTANAGFTAQTVGDVPLLGRVLPDESSLWGQHDTSRIQTGILLEKPEYGVPYAHISSPLRRRLSLINHLLWGAFVAGADRQTLLTMATTMFQASRQRTDIPSQR